MTDLEITKLCAEAMGYIIQMRETPFSEGRKLMFAGPYDGERPIYPWKPLHDDAQAMALVKRFDLSVWGKSYSAGGWKYHAEYAMFNDGETAVIGHGDTHNRAICECVAKMHLAKRTESESEKQ